VVIITGSSSPSSFHPLPLQDPLLTPPPSSGANSPLGIGRATAHVFAAHSAHAIYLCDLSSTHLATHARELNSLFPTVHIHTHAFDATSESAVKAVCEDAISRYGRLDVMFANAGVASASHFKDTSAEDFMANVRVNLLSVFVCIKAAEPLCNSLLHRNPTPAAPSSPLHP